MRLSDIRGQGGALALLSRALKTGRVANTYLFEGPDGVGKRTTALGLGLALVCTQSPRTGCGTCDDCRRVLTGNHPDVRLFAPGTAQVTRAVADEMIALAAERPHEATARLVILDDADHLNASAANTLLKTLEEPLDGNHFVLISSAPDRLLPTIRSRAQRVRFVPLAPRIVTELLRARHNHEPASDTANDRNFELVAALSDGSMARALGLLAALDGKEQGGGPAAIVTALRRAAGSRDPLAILDAAAGFSGTNEDRTRLGEALALLLRLYRDVLVTAAGASELAVLGEHADEVKALALATRKTHAYGPLRKAMAAVAEAQAAITGNVQPALTTEILLFRLLALENQVDSTPS